MEHRFFCGLILRIYAKRNTYVHIIYEIYYRMPMVLNTTTIQHKNTTTKLDNRKLQSKSNRVLKYQRNNKIEQMNAYILRSFWAKTTSDSELWTIFVVNLS